MIKQAARFIMIQRQRLSERQTGRHGRIRQLASSAIRRVVGLGDEGGLDQDPRSREAGLTVVEMLVATMIVAVGVVGASSVFVLSARSIEAAGTRSDASAVLASELETIRALPFTAIGVSAASPGYEAVVDGRPTVTGGLAAVVPFGQIEVEGQAFEIERAVTWVVVGSEPQGYKLVQVTVRWTDAAGDHDIAAQTGIFGDDDA